MRTGIRALACALMVGLVAACGGGGGGSGGFFPLTGGGSSPGTPTTPTPPTDPGTPTVPATGEAGLQGQVTLDGAAVAGATVSAGGQRTTTDADGRYQLTLDEGATSTVVVVKSAGHLTLAKEVPLVGGQTTTLDLTLQPMDLLRVFTASEGVMAVVNGAVIDIPADAIQDAAGNAYAGPVQLAAAYRNPTTVAGVDAFLQPYAGEAEGQRVNIQTVGVIEATLSTPDGQPLQLRQPATLIYPGVSVIDQGAATIPLWHYDEARALWVREGEATRQSDGSYLGQVSHFSAWNLDRQWGGAYTGATVRFCVNYENGASSRLGVQIYLEGPGFQVGAIGNPLDAGAHAFINAPAYTPFQMRFVDQGREGPDQIRDVVGLAPGETFEVLPCVTLAGTDDYVPPPPPPPPVPVAADTPVGNLLGALGVSGSWHADGIEWFGDLLLSASDAGVITGTAENLSDPDSGDGGGTGTISGQTAVGGYVRFTLTRHPGPTAALGPVEFTGRVYTDGSVEGSWYYTTPDATTPPGAGFRLYPLQPS